MKYGLSGIYPALMGHCPHCHTFGHFLIDDGDDPDYNYTAVREVPGAECCHCGHVFTAVKDGHNCLVCEPVVVAQPQPVYSVPVCSPTKSMSTHECFYCGLQKPTTGRFCPHCRLDAGGHPADAGATNFG